VQTGIVNRQDQERTAISAVRLQLMGAVPEIRCATRSLAPASPAAVRACAVTTRCPPILAGRELRRCQVHPGREGITQSCVEGVPSSAVVSGPADASSGPMQPVECC